jgi:DNA-binding Lrp family transcriptional regulator
MEPLLRLLQRDAMMPREEMARRLGMTVDEVNARIAELEASGVVVGYQAVIDGDKSGGDEVVIAVIEVRVRPERGGGFDRLARRIAKFDQVKSCYLVSGGYDLLVFVEGTSLREVSHFVSERLASMEGVLSTATRFRLKTYKENSLLIERGEEGERLSVTP